MSEPVAANAPGRLLASLAGLALLVFILSPDFFAPYRTPLGQALLSLLLIAYLGSLILMRRKAHQPERPRILLGQHR